MHPIYRIADQAFGYNEQTGRLVVVQVWTGFSGNRAAVVFATDDGITAKQLMSPGAAMQRFNEAKAAAPVLLTEAQARDKMAQIGLPPSRHCTAERCGAELPLGGLYCLKCGRPGTQPAARPTFQPARKRITA